MGLVKDPKYQKIIQLHGKGVHHVKGVKDVRHVKGVRGVRHVKGVRGVRHVKGVGVRHVQQ
jgi:hypothetical protein